MHDNISLEAEIEDGDVLEHVDYVLRNQIKALINDDSERRELLHETDTLSREKTTLLEDVKTIEEYVNKNSEALEKAGFDIGDFLSSSIPF